MQWQALLAGCAITALAAAIRRITGFGFAMVSVSLLSLAMRPAQAVLVTLILQLALGLRNIRLIVRGTRWRIMPWMIGAGIVSVPVSLAILDRVSENTLRLLIAASAFTALVPLLYRTDRRIGSTPLASSLSGFVAGFFNCVAAMPAPPLLIYMVHLRDMGLEERRVTLITMFTLLTIVALGGHLLAGGVDRQSVLIALALCPAAFLGDGLGRRAPWMTNQRATDVLSAVVIAGTVSILLLSIHVTK